jgi:hypothetical protein
MVEQLGLTSAAAGVAKEIAYSRRRCAGTGAAQIILDSPGSQRPIRRPVRGGVVSRSAGEAPTLDGATCRPTMNT